MRSQRSRVWWPWAQDRSFKSCPVAPVPLLFTYHEPAGPDTGNGQGQHHFFWPPPTISGSKLIIGNEDGYFRAFGL